MKEGDGGGRARTKAVSGGGARSGTARGAGEGGRA